MESQALYLTRDSISATQCISSRRHLGFPPKASREINHATAAYSTRSVMDGWLIFLSRLALLKLHFLIQSAKIELGLKDRRRDGMTRLQEIHLHSCCRHDVTCVPGQEPKAGRGGAGVWWAQTYRESPEDLWLSALNSINTSPDKFKEAK